MLRALPANLTVTTQARFNHAAHDGDGVMSNIVIKVHLILVAHNWLQSGAVDHHGFEHQQHNRKNITSHTGQVRCSSWLHLSLPKGRKDQVHGLHRRSLCTADMLSAHCTAP
jgi:hypothetical protein